MGLLRKFSTRSLVGSAVAVVALSVPAVGVSTGAFLTTNNASTASTQHIDTKLVSVACSAQPSGMSSTGPRLYVSPNGTYVVYFDSSGTGTANVWKTADITAVTAPSCTAPSSVAPFRQFTTSTGVVVDGCFSPDETKLYILTNSTTAYVLNLSTGSSATHTLTAPAARCVAAANRVYLQGTQTVLGANITTLAADGWSATIPTAYQTWNPNGTAYTANYTPFYTDGTYLWSATLGSSLLLPYLCKTTIGATAAASATSTCVNVGHEIHVASHSDVTGDLYLTSYDAGLNVATDYIDARNPSTLAQVTKIPLTNRTTGLAARSAIRIATSGDGHTLLVYAYDTSGAVFCPVVDVSSHTITAQLPSCGIVAADPTDGKWWWTATTAKIARETW